jgi:hypothetical protein
MGGGFGNSAPSITTDFIDEHWAVVQGTDNNLWIASDDGNFNWRSWRSLGVFTATAPSIASPDNTNPSLVISIVNGDAEPQFGLLSTFTEQITSGWNTDSSGFQTENPVLLTVVSGVIYALLIGLDDRGYNKPVYNSN